LGAQLCLGGITQAMQIAHPRNQIMSDFDDILPPAAAADEDRKKFRVREGTGPTG
jgi:hypothetical protein